MMADFQNGLTSRIFIFFGVVFAQKNSKLFVELILTRFVEFAFLTESEDFAWARASARWPIFKMVPFIEYLGFFGAAFCTEQLEMICRVDFDTFFGILIFDPQSGFSIGYSLCMMADFQNCFISGMFSFFWSGFCTQELQMICTMDFDLFFGILIFDPQ